MIKQAQKRMVTYRIADKLCDFLIRICDAVERDSGIRPTKTQVVELAIRDLAKKKKIN